jgi:hypothetical protein
MSEMHESQLHDWLRYRDELSRRLTVPDRVVRNVEALTLERPVRGMGRARLLLVAAAVAAVLFAAIALPHALLRSQPGGEYAPASTPRGVPNRVPPAGVALLWVIDPSDPGRLIAFDHDLHPVGWLAARADPFGAPLKQSGDGQRLLLYDMQKGDGTVEVTAQGQRIQLSPDYWNAAFSDDDRSVCIEEGAAGTPRTLVVTDPSGRAVHTIPEPPVGNPSYLSWHVVTCSVRNDLAVFIGEPDPQPGPTPAPTPTPKPTPTRDSHGLAIASVGGASESVHPVRVPAGQPNFVVRVVRLSTGIETTRRVYGPSRPQPIDASTDGTLVLERNAAINSYTVRNVVTGAVAATLNADVRNMLDNHLVIEQGTTTSGTVEHLVVDIFTGRPLWDETLPIGMTTEYIGDGAAVLVVGHTGAVDRCPASAFVELVDLSTGLQPSTPLNTCPSG